MRFSGLPELVRYGLVGALNTGVGYGVYLLGLRAMGWQPAWANALGYFVALLAAFQLNKSFVFRSSRPTQKAVVDFFKAFGLAFLANQGALAAGLELGLSPEIAQVVAMSVYTVTFFLLNKYFVFQQARD